MCTAALSHAGPVLGRGDMIDEAARRLLGLYDSAQLDSADGLVWYVMHVHLYICMVCHACSFVWYVMHVHLYGMSCMFHLYICMVCHACSICMVCHPCSIWQIAREV